MSLAPSDKSSRSNKPSTAVSHKKNNINNTLGRTGYDRDFLYKANSRQGFSGEATRLTWNTKFRGLVMESGRPGRDGWMTAQYVSPVIACKFPAKEFLPAWNVGLFGSDQGVRVFMRAYSSESARPSGWFLVGESGSPRPDDKASTSVRGWGRTRIDYVELHREAISFQYRIDFSAKSLSDNPALCPRLSAFTVHYSGQGGKAAVATGTSADKSEIHLQVPYRSQLTVSAVKLRNIICCPTSLSMVLEYYGVDRPTLDVCADAYDKRYKMYGVWPQVSHVAFQHGFTGWIHRFRTHKEVREYLSGGQPIIASIRVGKNELAGAKYGTSLGHIIVIVGMRKDGTYIVNDPASDGPGGGAIDYSAADMEKVWLDKGGVAILIQKSPTK